MALGTREMLLVIRARDEASRVLSRLSHTMRDLDRGAMQAAQDSMARGGALVSLGAGMAAVGGAGVAMLADMANAAGEYETAARKALTQADGVAVSLEQMKDLGRDVARDVPAAFDQMQEALYSIFSTIDTDLPGARKLLHQFAKAAVAGQTDVQTATVGGLQAINAFSLGVEGVTRVNDVMFQLVRKGVGTFDEFVVSIGKASPSANRAGQQIEDLAGMLAFMTRNGLSANMAATSGARAFDLLANAKVGERMEAMGIQVRDASGEFRPMADIVTDLGTRMQNLTAPERAEALSNLFKGSGNNIQARRFFDLAIPGFQQLNDLTGSMRTSAGAMGEAYDIMFESPQAKVQALTNKYEIMRTEIGDKLLPVKIKLMEALNGVLDWWNKLPDGVQNAIIIFGAVTAVLLVLVGIVVIAAGAIMILNGALAVFGTTLAAVFFPVTLIIAAIIAIIAALYLLWKYHEEIWDFIVMVWDAIYKWVTETFDKMVDAVVDWVETSKKWIVDTWNSIVDWVGTAVDNILTFFQELPGKVQDFLEQLPRRAAYALGTLVGTITKFFIDAWNSSIEAGVSFLNWWRELPGRLAVWFSETSAKILSWAVDTFISLRDTAVQKGYEFLKWFKDLPGNIKDAIWGLAVDLALWAIETWNNLQKSTAEKGAEFLRWYAELPGRILDWLKSLPGKMAEAGGNVLQGFWDGIVNKWNSFWSWMKGLWDSFIRGVKDAMGISSPSRVFLQIGLDLLQGLLNGVIQGGRAVWNFFTSMLPSEVKGALSAAGTWLFNAGKNLLEGLWNGISAAGSWLYRKIKGWAEGVIDDVMSFFGIASPSKVFAELGMYNMQGFALGMDRGSVTAVESAMNAAMAVNDAFNASIGLEDASFNAYAAGHIGGNVASSAIAATGNTDTEGPHTPVKIDIHTQEINPLQHAAELGMLISAQVA